MAQSRSTGQGQERGGQPWQELQPGGQTEAQTPSRGGDIGLAPFDQGLFPLPAMTSFRRIFDDFDRLFEDMQQSVFGRGGIGGTLPMRSPIESMLAPTGLLEGGQAAAWAPRIEVRDKGKEFAISAELPGVDPNDVQLEATDDGLVIRGETRQAETREEGGVWRSERRYGTFFRRIALPPDLVDADRAQAEFRNGVLMIRLPKTEAAQQRVRRIQIVGAEPIGGQQAAGDGQQTAADTATGAAGAQTGGEGRRRSASS